jgi:carbamoyltransferase
MSDVYLGPSYDREKVASFLDAAKIPYQRREDVPSFIARKLADGKLVGWFTGRLEMGPRALGHRSILADPRSESSRKRVNKYVKHREEWRPFAPSILEREAQRYLTDAEPAKFMIKTFDTEEDGRSEIVAGLHPEDNTVRPQTVTEEDNPRYYELIAAFESITGVPAVLNTSFNDHGEPIVNRPVEALRSFYSMGLDILVIEDIVVRK